MMPDDDIEFDEHDGDEVPAWEFDESLEEFKEGFSRYKGALFKHLWPNDDGTVEQKGVAWTQLEELALNFGRSSPLPFTGSRQSKFHETIATIENERGAYDAVAKIGSRIEDTKAMLERHMSSDTPLVFQLMHQHMVQIEKLAKQYLAAKVRRPRKNDAKLSCLPASLVYGLCDLWLRTTTNTPTVWKEGNPFTDFVIEFASAAGWNRARDTIIDDIYQAQKADPKRFEGRSG